MTEKDIEKMIFSKKYSIQDLRNLAEGFSVGLPEADKGMIKLFVTYIVKQEVIRKNKVIEGLEILKQIGVGVKISHYNRDEHKIGETDVGLMDALKKGDGLENSAVNIEN